MNDALGEPQSVLVLGGSSEIALATVKALPHRRLRRVILAARPSTARDLAVSRALQQKRLEFCRKREARPLDAGGLICGIPQEMQNRLRRGGF